MTKDIKLAVIGAGKWGINHVKTAYKILGDDLLFVCDSDPNNEKKVRAVNTTVGFTTDIKNIVENKDINAVIIATPAETHYKIAKQILKAGKHVLAEKPLTLHSSETEELYHLANHMNLKLMTGHVLLYHPAVVKMKEMIDRGIIGKVQYIYSNRLNLGTIRSEENILWSFAPHDISVIQYLLGSFPLKVNAYGASYLQPGIEDTTITILKYPRNVNAHIFVSWLHPFKEQRFVVIGDKSMLVFEDSLKSEKLKIYNKGFERKNGELIKFDAEYKSIDFADSPPLEEEQKHFFNSIVNDTDPLSDGKHAIEVLRILEMAESHL